LGLPAALGWFACGVGLSLFCFWFVSAAVFGGWSLVLDFPCFAFGLLALLLSVVGLWCWPFLVFMSVYLYCPCAGRHLLSLRPQRK
jgi:hypothetical protein